MLKDLPEEQLQGRDFRITPFLRQAVGQIYYARNQYEDAAAILEPLRNGDLNNEYIRLGVRYYLAALHHLGRSDEKLMQRLVEADEQEKAELDRLLRQST
jgi:hypothetical protein